MKKLILTLYLAGAVSVFAADAPFSSLTSLSALASGDLFAVTDISDTTQSANGTSKKITAANVGSFYINDTAVAAGWNADTTNAATKNALHDYFIILDTDLDGKVDVIDSTTAGFPAFNASGAFVASRSVGEGLAIDVTNPTGAAGDPTIAFDTTELISDRTWMDGTQAANVWTFNLTGTDPAITFSSGVVNVSTGTLQQGGVDVLTVSGTQSPTNKTYDASATGNVLKFKSLPQFTSPLRVDGTGCTIGTTSTTLGYGLGTFSNSADEAANWMEFRIIVPQDWDTSVTATIKVTDLLGGADTGTRRYVASFLSVAASASATGAPGTAINVDISADASGASGDVETSAATSLTGWAPTPGNLLILRIARDGDVATFDTSTQNSTVLAIELAYGASQ